MEIPTRGIEGFARETIDQCLVSQQSRRSQYDLFKAYALSGADPAVGGAIFNKTYCYLDDLESLLYSPVSLRYSISNPDYPNILEEAKGRAAATKLRNLARASETDTRISMAIWSCLVKGKSFIKSSFRNDELHTRLIQPDMIGVRYEAHEALDADMEAFAHTMFINTDQFARLVYRHPDRDELIKRSRKYLAVQDGPRDANRTVFTGGMYPYQPADSGTPNRSRGIVDWMASPVAQVAPAAAAQLMRLDELWVWNDKQEDWSTIQIIGEDMLILGKMQLMNAFAYDPDTGRSTPHLKGRHGFTEFCVNRTEDYFWGRSEVLNVALIQESLNARINGINRTLRKAEDPPRTFTGVAGVNQNAISRLNKPGGFFSDQNPGAKITPESVTVPQDIAGWVHELERMFDEMAGLPPIARGMGDSGVRSGNHAETLVRMFSPRFKDRALIAERAVEALGALHLDVAKAHISKKLIAWVPPDVATLQGVEPNPLLIPPVAGFVAVVFSFGDLDEDMSLMVDSHSSSPAFSMEAKQLVFDLLKIGAMDAADVVRHVDIDDPDALIAGIERRQIAAAKAQQQQLALKEITHAKK